MARIARPWYFTEGKAYAAKVKGRRVILVKGEESEANFRLAEKKLKQIVAGMANDAQAGALTVADVIRRYLALHKSQYSKAAYSARLYYLQSFAEVHGFRKVNDRDCLPVHVAEWIAAHPDWKSDWTKAHAVRIIMRPFNWAAKNRLIAANPFRGVEASNGEPRRPLTDAEFQLLLRNATVYTKPRVKYHHHYPSGRKVCPSDRRGQRPSRAARFRQALTFLRFTGCRPAELCALTWDDIDFPAQVIRLRRHKTSKKTRRPRIVPLHPVVIKLLHVIRSYGQDGAFVFLNGRKKPWQRAALSGRIYRIRQATGIPHDAKLYGLRHAFGTRAIVNGVDLKTLSELLGHTTVRMSEHYIALAGQQPHLAAAMLRVNASRPAPGNPKQSPPVAGRP